jgi:hypothetical protein
MGRPIIEAIGQLLEASPCVCGSTNSLIEETNGLLIEHDAIDSLFDAVDRMLEDEVCRARSIVATIACLLHLARSNIGST